MFVGEESCPNCLGCSCELAEPFIKCAECQPEPVYICLHCFAKGFENDSHLSNHSYEIMRRDFPILENSWTAAEEESLVTAVADCGVGNWADISTQISSKSKEECERHYFSCYVNNPVPPLPEFPEQEFKANAQPIVYKLSDDPPRPVEGSNMCIEMAGYLAARSEFSVEYDNFVELDLRHITLDEDEDKFDVDLKVAVLQTYHSCLRERQRRKRIIRKYGLINLHKACSTERRSERNLKPYLDTLCTVMRLMPPQEYDKYLEALNYEQDLKRDIHHLQEFHENGLTHLRHIKIYTLLKSRREIAQSKRHMLDDVLSNLQDETACQSWLQRQAALGNISKGFSGPLPSVPRRLAPPLEIVGLPGYDKLSSEERELCASTRLAPEAYLEFKSILITECKKVGTLKLAHARSLIKIDVNKTRRIYDFLLEQGFIKKDN